MAGRVDLRPGDREDDSLSYRPQRSWARCAPHDAGRHHLADLVVLVGGRQIGVDHDSNRDDSEPANSTKYPHRNSEREESKQDGPDHDGFVWLIAQGQLPDKCRSEGPGTLRASALASALPTPARP